MKHTPAPWITGEASWNEEGDVRYTLHGIKTAKVADCDLIAAAPDLLEALENIQKWMGKALADNAFKDCVSPQNAEHDFNVAINAIKKAKGEIK